MGPPADQTATEASRSFEEIVASYAQKLGDLLEENPSAFWRASFWTYGHWARRDSELQKILARTYSLLHEILRRRGLPDGAGAAGTARLPEFSAAHEWRIERLLAHDPAALTLDAALELFDRLDHVMIEIGDASWVCPEIEKDRRWKKGSTTWLTWEAVNGPSELKAVESYRSGGAVGTDLEAARNNLLIFHRARSDAYQVHRARLKMRARNLHLLGVLLLPLVAGLAWLLAAGNVGGASRWGVGLVAIAGALGAAMSGTINTRDKQLRGSDLRAFRAGLFDQLLIGSASALVVLMVLESQMLTIAGTETLIGKAAVGFVAGFSEPRFLKIVMRVATLGEEPDTETEKPTEPGTPPPSSAAEPQAPGPRP